MKRIATPAKVALLLLVLQIAATSLAQEVKCPTYRGTKLAGTTAGKAFTEPAGTWVMLGQGGKIIRLWRAKDAPPYKFEVSSNAEYTQVAILWLTAQQHAEFLRDAVEFINHNEVFECKVRTVVSHSVVQPKPDQKALKQRQSVPRAAAAFVANPVSSFWSPPGSTMHYVMVEHDNTSEAAYASLGDLSPPQ